MLNYAPLRAEFLNALEQLDTYTPSSQDGDGGASGAPPGSRDTARAVGGCLGAVARAGRLGMPGGQTHGLPGAGWTFGRLRRAVMVRGRGTTRPFGRIDLDFLLFGYGASPPVGYGASR